MASFEKCPVCGGAITEREMADDVHAGVARETARISAEVCLKCGERFYEPEGAQRLENSRSKYVARKTAMVQNTSLRAKLEYEIWFLNFLEQRIDRARENDKSPVFRITSGVVPSNIKMTFVESIFEEGPLINAMMPLTLVASFKTLDMIFEWILGENSRLGRISEVPWRFKEKAKLIKNVDKLRLPHLFDTHAHLFDYARALFLTLVPFRNEVVHSNSFSVSGDELTLSSSKKGITLTLREDQVDSLVRYVRILARSLIGEISVDEYNHRLIRYYLDLLAPVHGLATFNQRMPRFVRVELTAPRKGPAFPANLKQVRESLSARFTGQDVFFDLRVRAVDGDNLVARWHFSPDEVPDMDLLTLYEESHKTNRVEIVE